MTQPTYFDASTRRFGVEIECYMPLEQVPYRRSHIEGIAIEGNWCPAGWEAKRDGSLTSNYTGFQAVELVSPPMSGEEGLAQVVALADNLEALGTKVDKTTGLHIHVDASDLDDAAIERIVQAFRKHEKLFYKLVGKKANERYSNTRYCKPLKLIPAGYDRDSRYQSLNLVNLRNQSGKRTLEFRLFASTTNAEAIVTYICAVVGFVSAMAHKQLINDGVWTSSMHMLDDLTAFQPIVVDLGEDEGYDDLCAHSARAEVAAAHML